MWHIIQYRFKQTIREGSVMFWALAFPFILGTLFYFSFGKGGTKIEDMDLIKVAVVEEKVQSDNKSAFAAFVKEVDGDFIDAQYVTSKEAMKQLMEDQVDGIFYVKETPSLTVAKSDINQSILKSLMDSYEQNAKVIETIAKKYPEQLNQTLEAIGTYEEVTKEVSLGGSTTNPNVSYFFALIAYACLSGAFLGMRASFDGQANLSALGARRSITPTHKLSLVFVDLLVVCVIQFVNVSLLTAYIRFGLGVHLGDRMGALVLANLCGSVIGVSMGVLIGAVGKLKESIKIGITVALTLFPAFLAGLMLGNMKDTIEHHAPIVNRLNPAAVLSDAYYCLGVYSDMERFGRNLMILSVMSITCMVVAFWSIRRERYDSI